MGLRKMTQRKERVLEEVRKHPDGSLTSEIARASGLSNATVKSILPELARRNLVRCQAHPIVSRWKCWYLIDENKEEKGAVSQPPATDKSALD